MNREGVITIKQKYLSKSLVSLNSLSNSEFRLFCFPHAGGSSSFYRPWASFCAANNIELIAIQLPGREKRIHEPPLDNLESIVFMLTKEIVNYLDKPYAIFGHSMGSMVSYEVCKSLIQSNNQVPEHLFLSSCRAPHLTPRKDKIYNLPDDQFITKLRDLNGTPEEILNNTEFRAFFIPMLRSDFKIAETYQGSIDFQLDIPITSLVGEEDTVSIYDILEWEKHTASEFSHLVFTGDHFYINSHIKQIVDIIDSKLKGNYLESI